VDVERERQRCAADPAYFLGAYAKVNDAETLAVIPFVLWPHLVYLLDLWLSTRLSIVLKARQLGVSWLLAGYALWKAKFHTSASVLILSKGQTDAADVLAKAKFLEANLPRWLQTPTGKDNDSELEFPGHGAKIRALPATSAAGRGATASLVLMDELAHHEHARQNLVSISPTIGMHGRLVAVSTANGLANAYNELWDGAGGELVRDIEGDGIWTADGPGPNGYLPVFLHWSCRPGRDDAWLQQKRAELDLEPLLFKQEYPSTPLEAFVVSGRPVFGACELGVDPAARPLPLPPDLAHLHGLTLYRLPERGRWHLIGADVAQGLAHGDASCAIVLDGQTFAEMAHLHTTQPPDVFAASLHALASLYSGLVGVERNGPGHQVLYKLRELHTARTPYVIYADVQVLKTPSRVGEFVENAGQPGWVTTAGSKATMIGELEAALRGGVLQLGSALLVAQLRMYQRLDNGTTAAPSSKHDDCVMALAIAWQMRKWNRPLPRRGTLAISGLHA